MAFTAEAVAKLRLDTTDFERGLTRTKTQVADAGADMNRKLKRAFGAGDVFKGLLQGLGIGSVQMVVDQITKSYREAAGYAEQIYEYSVKRLNITERLIAARQSPEERIDVLKRKRDSAQKELDAWNATGWREFTTVDAQGGKTKRVADLTMGQKAEMERLVTEVTELGAEIDALAEPARLAKIGNAIADFFGPIDKLSGELYDLEKKRNEAVENNLKASEERRSREEDIGRLETDNARKKMDTGEEIADMLRERADLASKLIVDEEEDLDIKKRILVVDGKIADLRAKQADETERAAEEARSLHDAQEAVGAARGNQAQALRDRSSFSIGDVASGVGGNPTERAQARRALSLEARAKRIRGMTDFRDTNGKKVDSAAYADKLVSEADGIRKGIGSLNSSDKNPMEATYEAIQNSEVHLRKILTQLTPTSASTSKK